MTDLDVTIERVAAGGDGLARRPDGKVVFVAGALPGERVRAAVVDTRADFDRAVVTEVHEPSPARIAPPCPEVARGCGGCGWQHVAPDAQLELKAGIVRDALRRIAGRADDAALAAAVRPGVALDPFGFRTTIRVAVESGRAGFRRRHSHDVVAIGSCAVAHPLLEELIVDGWFGDATEVTLRCGARTGERLALCFPTARGVRLPADVTVVGADEVRKGRTARYAERIRDRRFVISAPSFFQARPDGAEALVDAVEAELPGADEPGGLVDAYCGVGLFAGLLGLDRRRVAVERDGPSVRDARDNLDRDGVTVVRSEVARWQPVPARVVIADPARPGLGRAAAARLAATGATRLVLVSCDPASLARDVTVLAGLGLRHVRSTLVDLFPHTPHVEVVSRFDRDPA